MNLLIKETKNSHEFEEEMKKISTFSEREDIFKQENQIEETKWLIIVENSNDFKEISSMFMNIEKDTELSIILKDELPSNFTIISVSKSEKDVLLLKEGLQKEITLFEEEYIPMSRKDFISKYKSHFEYSVYLENIVQIQNQTIEEHEQKLIKLSTDYFKESCKGLSTSEILVKLWNQSKNQEFQELNEFFENGITTKKDITKVFFDFHKKSDYGYVVSKDF